MNTFEKCFTSSPPFLDKLVSWNPDYIVPVAKKGCKLLRACGELPNVHVDTNRVRYKQFFDLNETSVVGKRIAVVDDATQYTSTLLEYRRFFEARSAIVRTFSFVGHERLFEGRNDKYDEAAEIGRFLPGPVYQEYILQQSYWLLRKGHHFDLDHLIFEGRLPHAAFENFCAFLRQHGQYLSLPDYLPHSTVKRFSLNEPLFHSAIPFIDNASVTYGPINKIKFSYDVKTEELSFSPMVFPTWDAREARDSQFSFSDCPFLLPFPAPRRIELSNSNLLSRTYVNISWIASISLVRSFATLTKRAGYFSDGLEIRRNDLDATFGSDLTAKMCADAVRFVNSVSDRLPTVSWPVVYHSPKQSRGKRFNNFGDVIDHCKNGYERKAARSRRRDGVHFYLPYERLFSRYSDGADLSEALDYHCDLGVIVGETIVRDGKFLRACRTGEPDSDTSWRRTQVLIPLAIDQLRKQLRFANAAVEPMLLNKVLANFLFDYPWEANRDLHCLVGVPNDFGALVHVHHRNRAPKPVSFYATDRVSPHYAWDKTNRKFVATLRPEFATVVKELFDERQEVPFTSITTYFRLLGEIYDRFKTVDVLNLLSIGREENCFYNHVLFNVRSAFGELSTLNDTLDFKADTRCLHEAGKHAVSAREKIHGAHGLGALMKRIQREFQADYDYVTALAILQRNYYPFSEAFYRTLNLLDSITVAQSFLANIGLYHQTGSAKYWKQAMRWIPPLQKVIPEKLALTPEIVRSHDGMQSLWKTVFLQLRNRMMELPREEPALAARIVHDEKRRARNIATNYCYRNNLNEITLLYIDFSGLRTIPEPKEEIISVYYRVVEKALERRGGLKLYGGRDGDDAYTLLFKVPRHAAMCAADIKREWREDLFLSTTACDVKFGIAYCALPQEEKETAILQCWGQAKDVCEFKGMGFRNRGHLLMDDNTAVALKDSQYKDVLREFALLEGITLSSGSKLYFHHDVIPFPNSPVSPISETETPMQ